MVYVYINYYLFVNTNFISCQILVLDLILTFIDYFFIHFQRLDVRLWIIRFCFISKKNLYTITQTSIT